MKKISRFSIHQLLVLATLALGGAALAAGCAAPPDTADGDGENAANVDEENVTEDGQAIIIDPDCCWGSFRCPTTGTIYEYDTPGCGPVKKSTAQTNCNNHCSSACTDSGWYCP